jgi:hypothetical protein
MDEQQKQHEVRLDPSVRESVNISLFRGTGTAYG